MPAAAPAAALPAPVSSLPTPTFTPAVARAVPAASAPSFTPGAAPRVTVAMTALPTPQSDPTWGYRGPAPQGLHGLFRDEWEAKRRASLMPPAEKDPRLRLLPATIGPFHSLAPLDDATRDTTITFFGFPSPVFRARHQGDGQLYALRALKNFRPSSNGSLERWKEVRHPSIVSLQQAFWTEQTGDLQMWFVYDFHPAARTLEMAHLVPGTATPFNEEILWSYICQLVSALRAIHAQGLACRCIYPSKVLVTSRNRLRINGVGISDVIHFDPTKIPLQQLDDLVSLGKLIMCLACRSAAAAQNVQRSLELIGSAYSADLKSLIFFLLSKGSGYVPTIEDVISRISMRMSLQLDSAFLWSDAVETQLSAELDNGRLFRLAAKLGMINERPEFDMDPSWSETGDRYLLKLFRDYVFHQVREDGSPVVSIGHVVDSLNRLDAATPDKIPLVSRDHKTVLLCSFKDLHKAVDDCFGELVKKQTPAKTPLVPPSAALQK